MGSRRRNSTPQSVRTRTLGADTHSVGAQHQADVARCRVGRRGGLTNAARDRFTPLYAHRHDYPEVAAWFRISDSRTSSRSTDERCQRRIRITIDATPTSVGVEDVQRDRALPPLIALRRSALICLTRNAERSCEVCAETAIVFSRAIEGEPGAPRRGNRNYSIHVPPTSLGGITRPTDASTTTSAPPARTNSPTLQRDSPQTIEHRRHPTQGNRDPCIGAMRNFGTRRRSTMMNG